MEYSPPPFFKTGPTPLARLLIFAALSLAFLVADVRFNYLEPLRHVAAIVVYPLQRIAAAPASIARHIGDFVTTHSSLREDNARLRQQNIENGALLLQLKALRAENEQLRQLLASRERFKIELGCRDGSRLILDESGFLRTPVRGNGSFRDVQYGRTDTVYIRGKMSGKSVRGRLRVKDKLRNGVRCHSRWVSFRVKQRGR